MLNDLYEVLYLRNRTANSIVPLVVPVIDFNLAGNLGRRPGLVRLAPFLAYAIVLVGGVAAAGVGSPHGGLMPDSALLPAP